MQDMIRDRARIIAQVIRSTEPFPVAIELARQAYAQCAHGVAIYGSNRVITWPLHRDRIRMFRSVI